MQFTFEELVIINNAINESLEAIDKQEYQQDWVEVRRMH